MHLSRALFLSLFLLLTGLSLSAGIESTGRVDVYGDGDGIVLTVLDSSPGVHASFQNWGKAETMKQRLVADIALSDSSWTTGNFKFKPSKDGTVLLQFKGPWVKAENGIEKRYVLFDSISVEGASIEDGSFEEGKGWQIPEGGLVKNKNISFSGENCVKVWHNDAANRRIQVKKDVPVTVSFACRAYSPELEKQNFMMLDISKDANMGFKDEVAGDGKGGWSDQGAENDFSIFDVSRRFFGPVPFKIVNPAENGGRSILTFSSPNISPEVKLKKVTLDAAGFKATTIYLLHTSCFASSKAEEPVGTVSVKVKGESAPREFQVLNKRDIADWWNPSGILENGSVVYAKNNEQSRVGVFLSSFKISETPVEVENVSFSVTGSAIWILAGATLSDGYYKLPPPDIFTVAESKGWKKPDMADVRVKSGTALDASQLVSRAPVGTYGRVIINKNGRFAFEKKPDEELRFFSCSFGDVELMRYKTKEEMRDFAETIYRQGYNMVRSHFLDHYLMSGGGDDLQFNMNHLDLFEYFIACLKERGIYLYFDAVTSWGAFKKGSGWGAKSTMNLKRDVMVLPEAREHWRAGVTKLLTHENPYTKTKLADDPVIAVMLFYNELEFYSFGSGDRNSGMRPELVGEWRKWLKTHYKNDIAALNKYWGNSNFNNFDEIPLFEGSVQWQTSPQATDAGLFMIYIENDVYKFFNETVRKAGYTGPVSLWDMCKLYRNDAARAEVPVISMHNYHAHPQGPWIKKGETISQDSSFANSAGYWRDTASTRFADRPFFVAEYGHVFWNATRYEEGLVFSAYSALQNFSGLMVHSSPVTLTVRNPVVPFDCGSDPIARANQVVTAFAFLRGDVAESKRYIELRFDDKFLTENGNLNRAPGAENMLSLICGFGIWYDNPSMLNLGGRPKPIAVIDAAGGAKVSMTQNTMDVLGSESTGRQRVSSLVSTLKEKGLLPKDNKSNPDKGIFQSDTGEILMDSSKHTMTVISPRLEGIASDKTEAHSLKNLSSVKSDVPASVTLISIDGKKLDESSRMLLVYATNALNDGMVLSGDMTALVNIGKGPAVMQTGMLELEILNTAAPALKVWALGFDGTQRELLPSEHSDGKLKVKFDTAKLKNGPTVFFEITAK